MGKKIHLYLWMEDWLRIVDFKKPTSRPILVLMEGWKASIEPRALKVERQREFKLEMKWAESCELTIHKSQERNSVKRIVIAYLERSVEQEHGRWCNSGCHHQSPCRPRSWRQERCSEGESSFLFYLVVGLEGEEKEEVMVGGRISGLCSSSYIG
jgi:hypothetical protein